MCAHVLVAEDDAKQAKVISLYLESEGHTVVVVHDGRAALDQARRRRPDLLVLDVMMPVVDGLDVCRVLRAESDLPILMLTARTTEADLLLGLDLGADDYMTKPYSPRELMARIRTLLRRGRLAAPAPGRTEDPEVLRVGPLTVDRRGHVVGLSGREIYCTPGEFEVLSVLAAQPDRVFTRRQLLAQAHGSDQFITERTIDAHVLNLRKKLEPDPRRPVHLVTVFGIGYKLTDGSGASPGARHRAR
ncbi:response regulator transcription factor [Streptacidiphilus sp. EB129]|jgi:two-component system response regulator RegX3|uniref:response regulator transcription factor n=1 Tax=Streptacidiphilus sp. EB129 TaxID=3156262 RepID=UPI00351335AC